MVELASFLVLAVFLQQGRFDKARAPHIRLAV
jgi:hypothetical protein